MNSTYINMALTAGGELSIKQVMRGKTMFKATMNWQGEQPVSGEIGLGLESTLESLNTALMEDAAKQK